MASKTKPGEVEKVFEEDEMNLREVDLNWSKDELLSKEDLFFLKDVVKVLDLDPAKVKKKAKDLDGDPWQIMGVRKMWTHWIVRMKIFSPFYKKHLVSKVKSPDPAWDGNTLLKQKGIFFLTDVCKLIPFSTHQLRYQAKKNPNAKEEYGVWKDPKLKGFLVDMEKFGPWINSLWDGNFK